MNIYSEILDCFKKNISSVIATIISQRGTSPRGTGAKMLIMGDGSIAGSVGGGILEKTVIETSAQVFSSGSPARFSSDREMACGGDVEIFLEPVPQDNDIYLRICREVMHIIKRGGAGILATAMDTRFWRGSQPPKALLKLSGEATGYLPNMEKTAKIIMEGMQNYLKGRRPDVVSFMDAEGNEFSAFIEPVISDPVLYIFGAGHVSSQVAPVARRVGFKIFVIDDRPEFADPLKFPDAEKVLTCPYNDVIKRLHIDRSSFIVIATRSHSCDEIVLAQALHTDAGYIGMIGSRRKISTIYSNLLNEGFAQADFSRVHSPIGIDIGAETPEEIALSIVSELVKARAT